MMLWFQKFTAFMTPIHPPFARFTHSALLKTMSLRICYHVWRGQITPTPSIWVYIISHLDKFQRILVIRPFKTTQNHIFQSKLWRKLIKWKLIKAITLCCPIFNGKELLGHQCKQEWVFYNIVCILSSLIYIEDSWRDKKPATTVEMQESKH